MKSAVQPTGGHKYKSFLGIISIADKIITIKYIVGGSNMSMHNLICSIESLKLNLVCLVNKFVIFLPIGTAMSSFVDYTLIYQVCGMHQA